MCNASFLSAINALHFKEKYQCNANYEDNFNSPPIFEKIMLIQRANNIRKSL